MQVIVKNFQSIDEVKLNIKGFTLLIGESNQGKSATLRALRAAVTNRFRSGQVRNGTDRAEIAIKFSDEEPVLRVAKSEGSSANMRLGDLTFSKLGRTVPREVTEACNMECIGDDSYNLNFHEQFEAPMLLEFSQPRVMELLSASDALDDLKLCKDGLLDRRAENKGAFESLDAILSKLKCDADGLCRVVEDGRCVYDEMVDVLREYEAVLADIEGIELLGERFKELYDITERADALRAVVEALRGLPEDGSEYERLIRLRGDYERLSDGYAERCEYVERMGKGVRLLDGLEHEIRIIDQVVDLSERIGEMDKRVVELERFVSGGICPICGNVIEKE